MLICRLTWLRLFMDLGMFSRLIVWPPSPIFSKWTGLGGKGGGAHKDEGGLKWDKEEEEEEDDEIFGAEIWETRERLRAGKGGGISEEERVCRVGFCIGWVWWWGIRWGWELGVIVELRDKGGERGWLCNWKQ